MAQYRILIVDDQRDVRRMLRAGLETLGPEFLVADVPSGEEAMLVILRHPIDLLVADVRLPGISGLELQKRALMQNPALKLILVTGMTDHKVRREVAEAGADAFFFKPVEISEFLNAVERCLGRVKQPPLDQQEPAQPDEYNGTAEQNISERLANLRQVLGALCTMLLDERGRVVARAGESPDATMELDLVPALMTTVSASHKVFHYLGVSHPQGLMCFTGQRYDLLLSQVGLGMALLLVLPNLHACDPAQMGSAALAARQVADDLQGILENMGIPVETPAEVLPPQAVSPVEEEINLAEVLPAIDMLFKQAAVQPPAVDVNAFWDSLVEEENAENILNADAISYEQARQLGLAPETKKK